VIHPDFHALLGVVVESQIVTPIPVVRFAVLPVGIVHRTIVHPLPASLIARCRGVGMSADPSSESDIWSLRRQMPDERIFEGVVDFGEHSLHALASACASACIMGIVETMTHRVCSGVLCHPASQQRS